MGVELKVAKYASVAAVCCCAYSTMALGSGDVGMMADVTGRTQNVRETHEH